jgi:acetyltransferase-like isoleucine patch superfamily enzyme
MSKKVNIAQVIQQKGLLEFFVYGSMLFLVKFISYIRIFFLKIRGYNIDYSVILRGRTLFFQSSKHAITISQAIIGTGTRISAGGTGKIKIGRNVLIDEYTFIMAHNEIVIGENTTIAAFCFITDFKHQYSKNLSVLEQGFDTDPVIIGKNVWIGTHCVILPGVKIGDGSVVGAGSIVTRDIPENSIAVGNPAKVIKKIKKNA